MFETGQNMVEAGIKEERKNMVMRQQNNVRDIKYGTASRA
jgi:hypothetical protein